MNEVQKAGTLGNLTIDEERKLQEAWVHLFRLAGVEALDGHDFSHIPDLSDTLRQHLSDKTAEGFKKNLWTTVRSEHPDGLVLRFLRARKWDVEAGMGMMISCVNWRKESDVDSRVVFEGESVGLKEKPTIDDKSFIDQYRSGKSYVRGLDKAGRPVYIIRAKLHDPRKQSPQSMENYILHNIESLRVLVKAPYDEACLIFDLTGFGLKNMDFHVVKFLVGVFEARYPETLGAVLIHNAPFVFSGIWSIIKGWLDPVIASKIHFTRNTKDMKQFIDLDNLQKRYGGDDTWEYVYPDPVPGENPRLGDDATRATILEDRETLAQEFVLETIGWAALDVESEEGKAKAKERDQVAAKLQENYWKLDPYVRATTYLHRVGVVNEKGEVDFKGAKSLKA